MEALTGYKVSELQEAVAYMRRQGATPKKIVIPRAFLCGLPLEFGNVEKTTIEFGGIENDSKPEHENESAVSGPGEQDPKAH